MTTPSHKNQPLQHTLRQPGLKESSQLEVELVVLVVTDRTAKHNRPEERLDHNSAVEILGQARRQCGRRAEGIQRTVSLAALIHSKDVQASTHNWRKLFHTMQVAALEEEVLGFKQFIRPIGGQFRRTAERE